MCSRIHDTHLLDSSLSYTSDLARLHQMLSFLELRVATEIRRNRKGQTGENEERRGVRSIAFSDSLRRASGVVVLVPHRRRRSLQPKPTALLLSYSTVVLTVDESVRYCPSVSTDNC